MKVNKSTQNCQMDIEILFWSQEAKEVKVRYLDPQFIGDLENYNKSLLGLDLSKIIQISMDGPTVNWCFYGEVVKNREEMELHQLINIGDCGLHIIHGSFNTVIIEVTDWNIKVTVKSAFWILHDSLARRADNISVSGSNITPCSSVPQDGWKTKRLLKSYWKYGHTSHK